MAAPARRVLAVSIPARLRPIQNDFDPAAHSARRLGFYGPDRLNGAHDEPDIDILHREAAERGIDVRFECRLPLRSMLPIAPGAAVRIEIAPRAILEAHRLSLFEQRSA